MSLNNFIPEVWSALLLKALRKDLVYGGMGVINRDYEGEIANGGDTVRINSIGDVTISDYTKDADINAPETLNDAQQVLTIDQQKYFNFAIDDIDKAQQKPQVMGEAISRSAYGLRDKADQFIAALYTGVSAATVVGLGDDNTPLVPSANTAGTTVYDYLVEMGILLDEANIPSDGRFAVLPAWAHGRMLHDDRFVSFGTADNIATRTNGKVGEAAGFTIYKSNNVPQTSGQKYKIIAGHPMAWSYAEQITKVEAYRPQLRFSDAIKGLHVYGAKLVRPEAISVATFNKS